VTRVSSKRRARAIIANTPAKVRSPAFNLPRSLPLNAGVTLIGNHEQIETGTLNYAADQHYFAAQLAVTLPLPPESIIRVIYVDRVTEIRSFV